MEHISAQGWGGEGLYTVCSFYLKYIRVYNTQKIFLFFLELLLLPMELGAPGTKNFLLTNTSQQHFGTVQ